MASPEIEAVHQAFRVSAEFGKILRVFAFLLEVGAAITAVVGTASGGILAAWVPIVAVTVVLLTSLVRMFAGHQDSIANGYRREALRAYALGAQVDDLVIASVVQGALPGWLQGLLTMRLKSKSIDQYYLPQLRTGQARLHELVCHSAFFTAPVLRFHGFVLLGGFSMAGLATFLALHRYITAFPEAGSPAGWELDSWYGIVFGLLGVRALENSIEALSASREAQEVVDGLTDPDCARLGRVEGWVAKYDEARLCGPATPTYVFQFLNDRLSKGWEYARRRVLAQYP